MRGKHDEADQEFIQTCYYTLGRITAEIEGIAQRCGVPVQPLALRVGAMLAGQRGQGILDGVREVRSKTTRTHKVGVSKVEVGSSPQREVQTIGKRIPCTVCGLPFHSRGLHKHMQKHGMTPGQAQKAAAAARSMGAA